MLHTKTVVACPVNGYKYIIGAKIKNESKKIKEWILEQPKVDRRMVEYGKGNGQRLLVGYTEDRARKMYTTEKRAYAGLKRPINGVPSPRTT